MEKLKNCPFCGGEPIATVEPFAPGFPTLASLVICRSCGASTRKIAASTQYCSDDKAAKAWNLRAEEVFDSDLPFPE